MTSSSCSFSEEVAVPLSENAIGADEENEKGRVLLVFSSLIKKARFMKT